MKLTDQAFTKPFDAKAKGFSGTSINPTYMTHKATKLFGPIGIGWGVDVIDERYVNGSKIDEHSNVIIHVIKVELWYWYYPPRVRVRPGETVEKVRGSITHYGSTPFVTARKANNTVYPFTDAEAQKKSFTDATGKALSMLGFSADVYTGLYDNPEYKEEAKNKIALQNADDKDEELANQRREYIAWRERTIKLLETAASINELNILYKTALAKMTRKEDASGITRISEFRDNRESELRNKNGR